MEEASIARHKEDRKVKSAEEEKMAEENYLAEEFDEVKVTSDNEEGEEKEKLEIAGNLEPVQEIDAPETEPSEFPDTSFQMKIITSLSPKETDGKKTHSSELK